MGSVKSPVGSIYNNYPKVPLPAQINNNHYQAPANNLYNNPPQQHYYPHHDVDNQLYNNPPYNDVSNNPYFNGEPFI